jgi:hypothetical protein
MNCLEVESYVSVLYDGEQVPVEAANHIGDCPVCRNRLRAYSEIGVEIRLVASSAASVSVIPPELVRKMRAQKRSTFHFLRQGVVLPRFALAALVLALLAIIPASWAVVRAQSRPLWFQFDLHPKSMGSSAGVKVVKAGYNDHMAWMFLAPGQHADRNTGPVPLSIVGAHVVVRSVQDGKVQLEIAARNFGEGNVLPAEMKQELQKAKMHRIMYVPNETVQIPIEGGGTLTLRGDVLDHQPKMAAGFPLEPGGDQMFMRSPILVEGNRVLADLQGATSIAEGEAGVVLLSAPGTGRFAFGIHKFPGAVKGKVNWGYLTFKIGGKSYTLAAEAPICGGEQPRTVWVSLNTDVPPNTPAMLGSGSADQLREAGHALP